MSHLRKILIASDQNRDWEGHAQTIQDNLPIVSECDSINYFRYASWYLENIESLRDRDLEI